MTTAEEQRIHILSRVASMVNMELVSNWAKFVDMLRHQSKHDSSSVFDDQLVIDMNKVHQSEEIT